MVGNAIFLPAYLRIVLYVKGVVSMKKRSIFREAGFTIFVVIAAMIAFSASQRTVASRVAHAQIIAVPFTLEAEQYKVTPNGWKPRR